MSASQPIDERKVRRVLALLNELTKETNYIIGSAYEAFPIRENGGYGNFLVEYDYDTNTYYTHAKPRKITAGDIE
jgi:hypothetical protein